MKARVKATGKITEVKYSRQMGPDTVYRDLMTGEHYMDFELSFLPEDGTPDYWTRLKHQYAGMAMQGLLTNPKLCEIETSISIASTATTIALTLIDKLKEESKCEKCEKCEK